MILTYRLVCSLQLHYLLGETEKAVKVGERALTLHPHSAELRNLLLLAAPDTWTDRMRSAPSTEGHSEPVHIFTYTVNNIGGEFLNTPILFSFCM